MSVYVDDSGIAATVLDPGSGRSYTSRWSHLFCDGELAELHAFAARIGLRRAWFQGPPAHRFPHYDVTANKRAQAIRAGATEVTWREAVQILRSQLELAVVGEQLGRAGAVNRRCHHPDRNGGLNHADS
jgi:hypothetical protein